MSSTTASSAKPGSWGAILEPLATFYHRRWLIRYLVQRRVFSNYRGSYLGFVWAFLSPLMMVILLTIVFSKMLGIRFREVTGDSSLNFGLYLYCGLLPFLAYQQALTEGVTVIRRNSELVQKVAFPLEILPLTTVFSSFILNSFGLGALILVYVVLEQQLHWTMLLLPLVMVLQLLFTLGLNYLMGVAGTYMPDTRETLRTLVRATFFITPIIWPAEKVPERYRFLIDYNPLAILVKAYRNLILGGEIPDVMATIYFSIVAIALFAVGFVVFNRVKHNFADLL